MSDGFAGIIEIIKNIILWLIGRRQQKQEHKQQVSETEQSLNDAIDNGNTVGEISEAIEDLKNQHKQ